MIISITELGTYRRCRRQWNYASSSRGNLTTKGVNKPALELGSLIHGALEDWHKDTSQDLDAHFANRSTTRLQEVIAKYKNDVGVKISASELDPLYETIELGLAMMKNYQIKYKTPLPSDIVFAIMEQEILVDIPGTEHPCPECKGLAFVTHSSCNTCNGKGVVFHKLRVKLDGLIRNRNGVWSVLERKTYSRVPDIRELESNDQFTGYLWSLRELKLDKIGGVAYDGMWKRATPPKGKSFNDLFIRTTISFNHHTLDQWGLNLAKQINEIAKDPPIYPNRRWEGCKDCSFEKLCNAETRGEDHVSIRAEFYTQRDDNKVKGLLTADDIIRLRTATV